MGWKPTFSFFGEDGNGNAENSLVCTVTLKRAFRRFVDVLIRRVRRFVRREHRNGVVLLATSLCVEAQAEEERPFMRVFLSTRGCAKILISAARIPTSQAHSTD